MSPRSTSGALTGRRRCSGRRDHAELKHRGEVVACRPVLAESRVGDPVPMALIRNESLVCWWREPTEPSTVRPGGTDANRHHVALGDERLDRHLKVRELRSEPFDDLPRVRRTMNAAGLFAAEGRDRVLDVVLGHDLVGGSGIPTREELVEETPDQQLSDFLHSGSFSLGMSGCWSLIA